VPDLSELLEPMVGVPDARIGRNDSAELAQVGRRQLQDVRRLARDQDGVFGRAAHGFGRCKAAPALPNDPGVARVAIWLEVEANILPLVAARWGRPL
jgi:hypothetical protein